VIKIAKGRFSISMIGSFLLLSVMASKSFNGEWLLMLMVGNGE
jgi:hypothetical protein